MIKNMADTLDNTISHIQVGNELHPLDATFFNGKSDTLFQEKNLVTTLSANSTDTQYPSAKCIWDILQQYGSFVPSDNTDEVPRLFFDTLGSSLPTAKADGTITVKVTYTSSTDSFSCYGTIKVQGTSSQAYPKKNWTLKLYSDQACTTSYTHNFRGWGEQSKFTIKADWIDLSHARNVVGARLWGDVVASRSDLASLPEGLRNSPNYGAIDGFVVKGYINGYYYGRYDITIAKGEFMVGMDKDTDGDVVLCGEDYNSACFRSAWGGVNDTGWSDELRDETTSTVVNQLNAFINFVLTSSDADFVSNFSNYADLTSFIDYYIFHYFICGLDAFGKNQILLSYAGGIYYASSYDMDSTFGIYWNGSSYVSTSYRCQEDYETGVHQTAGNGYTNLLYDRIAALYPDEIATRYAVLRSGPLSLENIINRFEDFLTPSVVALQEEDYASTTGLGVFTTIPGQGTNTIQQIRNYIAARAVYVDSAIVVIPLTGISINGDDTIVGTEGTYTVTYTPTNASHQNVTWSITSGSEYASINSSTGVVTLTNLADNSSVTITATSVEYPSISASKTITATYSVDNPLTALTINGDDTVTGVSATYAVTYTPSNTEETGVAWSIVSGSEYATIGESTGQLIVLNGANESPVTIMATSTVNSSITATKNITVTCDNIIYSVSNVTFDGTNPINTGIQLWQLDNWQMTLTATFGTQTVNQATIAACMDETGSPWQGFTWRCTSATDTKVQYNLIGTSTLVNNSSQTYNTTDEFTFVMTRHGTELTTTMPNGTTFTSTLPTQMTYTGELTLGDAYNYSTGSFLGRTFIGTIVDCTIIEIAEETEEIELPAGYTRLAYIASTATGGQYIDLNLNMYETSPISVNIDMSAMAIGVGKDSHNQAVLLGASSEASPYYGHFIRKSSNNLQSSFDGTTYSIGGKINIVTSVSNYTNTHNVGTTLFCGYAANGSTPQRFIEARIYYCKIRHNSDDWERELWPCLNTSGVPGLYDLVNGVFYSSQGDADFEYGT